MGTENLIDMFEPTARLRFVDKTITVNNESKVVKILQQLWIRDVRCSGGVMLDIYMEDPYEREWRDVPYIQTEIVHQCRS